MTCVHKYITIHKLVQHLSRAVTSRENLKLSRFSCYLSRVELSISSRFSNQVFRIESTFLAGGFIDNIIKAEPQNTHRREPALQITKMWSRIDSKSASVRVESTREGPTREFSF